MRLLGPTLLAAAVLAAPAWSQAPAPAPSVVSAEVRADALALAQLVEPAEEGMAVAMAAGKEGFFKLLEEDADSASLEADYPGISQAIWDAMEPLMRESTAADMPKLWDALANLYIERLTPAEIAGLRRFYGSPAGRKMVRLMNEKTDVGAIIEATAKSANGEISREAFEKAQKPARAAAARAIGPEDEAALADLSKSIPMPKLYALGAEVQRITFAWMNAPDPEFDAKLEKVVGDRVASFMAEADAKQ